MRTAAALIATLAGCDPSSSIAVVEGERPIECDPGPVDQPRGEFDAPALPVMALMATLPAFDPDCTPATFDTTYTTAQTWRDQGQDRTGAVTVAVRTTRERIAGSCRVRFVLRAIDGPAGRDGAIELCGVELISDVWATLSQIPVTVDAIAVDGEPIAIGGLLPWSDPAAASSCEHARIERAVLLVQVETELQVTLVDWVRLHSLFPAALRARVAVEAH